MGPSQDAPRHIPLHRRNHQRIMGSADHRGLHALGRFLITLTHASKSRRGAPGLSWSLVPSVPCSLALRLLGCRGGRIRHLGTLENLFRFLAVLRIGIVLDKLFVCRLGLREFAQMALRFPQTPIHFGILRIQHYGRFVPRQRRFPVLRAPGSSRLPSRPRRRSRCAREGARASSLLPAPRIDVGIRRRHHVVESGGAGTETLGICAPYPSGSSGLRTGSTSACGSVRRPHSPAQPRSRRIPLGHHRHVVGVFGKRIRPGRRLLDCLRRRLAGLRARAAWAGRFLSPPPEAPLQYSLPIRQLHDDCLPSQWYDAVQRKGKHPTFHGIDHPFIRYPRRRLLHHHAHPQGQARSRIHRSPLDQGRGGRPVRVQAHHLSCLDSATDQR